ncbi:uncharacterized protein G2W53_031138 [Senna tora]|uniref:Uncharacterized protein n=1 Tax=Senna tora TaxID=362788 RepID=A0A834TGX1_9FABA|nr:uncharacterized protein G2W53_031138 [Senna tora]
MKRKDVEEFHDDFSSTCLSNSSRKSRRLRYPILVLDKCKDAELVGVMDEDPNVNATLERGLSVSQELLWTSSVVVHADAASIHSDIIRPTSNASEERALVLHDPTKIPFVKSPSPPEFSIVVKSDLIPGLKNYLSSWECSKGVGISKEKKEDSSEGLRDSLAVIPWVAFHSSMVCEKRVYAACHPLETEGEMMDTDEPYVSNVEDMEIGEMVEAVGSF